MNASPIKNDPALAIAAVQPNWIARQAAEHYIESLKRSGTTAKRRAYHRGRFIVYIGQLLTTLDVDEVLKLFYMFQYGSDAKLNAEGEAVIRKLAEIAGKSKSEASE